MGETHVLAIDVGSSSLRAGVFLSTGECVATSRLSRSDALSGLNFDADRLWTSIVDCVGRMSAELRNRIEAIGVTAHIGSVFLDKQLRVVGPGRGWADSAGMEIINSGLGAQLGWLLALTGRPALTGGPLASLLALREANPQDYATIAHVTSPKDFINARLTGRIGTDETSAAYFGSFDVFARQWSDEILSRFDLSSELFPKVQPAVSAAGALLDCPAAALGLRAGIPVASGGPDGTVGASFVLAGQGDSIANISGTTDVLVRVLAEPADRARDVLVNPYVDGKRWTVGGSTGSTGGALSYWANILGLSAAYGPEFESEIASVPPGALGLAMKPFLTGSRFPRWRAEDRASVSGLGEQHRRAHFLRAAVEAITFSAREGIDLLASGERNVPLILAGGMAKSPLLAQMRADILGRDVLVVDEPDVSLSGAARVAFMMIEGVTSRPSTGAAAKTVRPDPKAVSIYDKLFRRWQEG